MITITEKKTTKLPGLSSLYVYFDYNQQIVNTIKSITDVAVFDKNTKIWEVPTSCIHKLVDELCLFDDIAVKLLPEKDNKAADIILNKHKTTPFDYQEEGIKFGLNHDKWLLLDAPGLGKSLQMIQLAEELKEREGIEHCLIVCGINTLKANWQKEVSIHCNQTSMILGQKTTKTGKIVNGSVADRVADLNRKIDEFFIITNIETLRSPDVIKAINKGPNNIDMIVLDECHRCKSPTSQQTKGLLKLKDIKYQVGLTGTVVTNNPLDAYVPLKWIGAEKANYTNFKYYYCTFGGPFNNIVTGYKNMDILKAQLDKYALRRTKDLLDLPPKTVINEYVDMDDKQKLFYNNIKEGVIEQVDKVHMSTANLLAMVARLRQATACPAILSTEDIPSAKIERAVDLAEQIVDNGDKVVIFSTFKETLKTLEEKLAKYNPTVNTGDIKDTEISKNIDDFQTSNDSKIFLGTWQKCGTGITLTAATYMIFLDTPWTSADYIQAQDRIYRIGTTNKVTIYNLICRETIDERVLEIVNDKAAISDYIVDDMITEASIKSLRKYIEELE